MTNIHPIFYSFRRCPYAMRARMGLYQAKIKCEHREIILRNKPAHMLEISPKGSVPILQLPSGEVIDESLDIMLWALNQNDPDSWVNNPYLRTDIYYLIERNDTIFKAQLDRYKYPDRYPDENCTNAREDGLKILHDLDQRIAVNNALSGDRTTIADIAIFPFIRQFAHVDKEWFNTLPLPHLHKWLKKHLASTLFTGTMIKHEIWEPDLPKTYTI